MVHESAAWRVLTLAGTHLLVWLHSRKEWGHLLFTISAVTAASMAACEMLLMHVQTVPDYGALLKWGHLIIWLLVVSVVWFARLYLHAGREWLAWSVIGLRTIALLLSSIFPFSLSYSTITGLQHIPFLGETISLAQGKPNPWSIVSQLSSLLLLIFFVDAAHTLWRRGERRRAVILGGGMIFFILVAAIHSALIQTNTIRSPYLISFAFLGIIVAMAYELSKDVLRASQLISELQASEAGLRESEERMSMAADAAKLGIWVRDLIKDEIWASDNWRSILGFTEIRTAGYESLSATNASR